MASASEEPAALDPSGQPESLSSSPHSMSERAGKGDKLADALRRAVNLRQFIHERRESQEHAGTQGDDAGPSRADLMARLDLAESIIASQEEEIRQQYLEIDSLVKSSADSARKFVMHRDKAEKEAKSLQDQTTKYEIAAEQSEIKLRQSRNSTEHIARSLLSMTLEFQLELQSLTENIRADREAHEKDSAAAQQLETVSLAENTDEQVRSLELELVILSEESLFFQQKADQMLAVLTAEKDICESALSQSRGQNAQLMEELQSYKTAHLSRNSHNAPLETEKQVIIRSNPSSSERSGVSESQHANGHAQSTNTLVGSTSNPASLVDAEKSTRELYVKLTAANEEIAVLRKALAELEKAAARAVSNAELLNSELVRKEEQLRDATEQVVNLRLEQARNKETAPNDHLIYTNAPTPSADPSTVSQIQESLAQLEEDFRSVQHLFALDRHHPSHGPGKAGSLGARASASSLRTGGSSLRPESSLTGSAPLRQGSAR